MNCDDVQMDFKRLEPHSQWFFALDVVDEPSEDPAGADEPRLLALPLLLLLLVDDLLLLVGVAAVVLRGQRLRRLDPDRGVPLAGRQHRHRVQELVDARQQMLPLLGLFRKLKRCLLFRSILGVYLENQYLQGVASRVRPWLG